MGAGAPGAARFALAAVTMLALTAAPALAHKHHDPAAESLAAESTLAVPGGVRPGDSAPAAPDSLHAGRGAVTGARLKARPYVMPPFAEILREHVHNKIVHFPVALAFGATLLLLLGPGRPEFQAAAHRLIWFAALAAVAAYFTGRMQEEAFEGESREWVMRIHRNWGTATTIAIVIWAVLSGPRRTRAWVGAWAAVVILLVLVTAFYGGVVAHGE